MLRHLANKGRNPKLAFSPDGIDEMNKSIVELNGGRFHQPIYKVRVYEKGDKFSVGDHGNKKKKFVEAAKGTNLFFAIYENTQIDTVTGQPITVRSFDTIPLNVVIGRLKQGLSSAPNNSEGLAPKYVLSPNDLVYLPTEDELKQRHLDMPLDKKRIYKMVSSNNYQVFFIPLAVATMIVDKKEFSSANKQERAVTGEMIKSFCIPIRVNRLGEISL